MSEAAGDGFVQHLIDTADDKTGDLFEEKQPVEAAPSEGVYVDAGSPELAWIGEVQLPTPTPVELIVVVGPWQYVYKLDRRDKTPEEGNGT